MGWCRGILIQSFFSTCLVFSLFVCLFACLSVGHSCQNWVRLVLYLFFNLNFSSKCLRFSPILEDMRLKEGWFSYHISLSNILCISNEMEPELHFTLICIWNVKCSSRFVAGKPYYVVGWDPSTEVTTFGGKLGSSGFQSKCNQIILHLALTNQHLGDFDNQIIVCRYCLWRLVATMLCILWIVQHKQQSKPKSDYDTGNSVYELHHNRWPALPVSLLHRWEGVQQLHVGPHSRGHNYSLVRHTGWWNG